MIINFLQNLDCTRPDLEDYLSTALSKYNYKIGTSKIVVDNGNFMIKKVFGKPTISEVEISLAANSENLNDFFALAMLPSGDGTIYIQEKIDITLPDYIRSIEKILYGSFREIYREMGLQELLYRSDCVVLYYLFRRHNLEEILKFQEFVVKHNLTDLMFYNAGFDSEGNLKFFDYSGIDRELME